MSAEEEAESQPEAGFKRLPTIEAAYESGLIPSPFREPSEAVEEAHAENEAAIPSIAPAGEGGAPDSTPPSESILDLVEVVPETLPVVVQPRREPPPALEPPLSRFWNITAASVTGPAHVERNERGQDSSAAFETPDGHIVAIVSDGAGSAFQSGFASGFLSNGVVALARAVTAMQEENNVWRMRTRFAAAIAVLREALLQEVRAGEHRDDYLATLVGVIAHAHIGVVIFHLGDGVATIRDAEGEPLFTSQPENGEYLNETFFLVDEDWRRHLRMRFIRWRQGARQPGDIFLMSDGAADLSYNRVDGKLVPERAFFDPVAHALSGASREAGERMLAGTLRSEDAARRSSDDKTLVWLRPVLQNG